MADTTEDKRDFSIAATEEAATLNGLAIDIAAWAKGKGFAEELDDADWLENWLIKTMNFNGDVGARLVKIAEAHRRMFMSTKLMLIVSEAAEALEAQRDGDEQHFDVELAGLLIRVLDLAGTRRSPIGDHLMREMARNVDRPYKHGRKM